MGRDLARVLQCGQKGNGYFQGAKYIVTWALGHLVTLADPEIYDEKYVLALRRFTDVATRAQAGSYQTKQQTI